ncbi:MAG TPA: LptA/OstA family protein [Terriglobales bacterium]|nr:LptA/OstA family protein [Terriglobales bacterium]
MPITVVHLRRWFAAGAILMVAIVAGMYLYARWRVRNALHDIPKRIGVEISQTAQGFSFSKSEEGRTLFTVSASKAVQFKQGGRAELHDVKIVVYGRDSTRFDRITGADFEFDPTTGNVTAKGPVTIDLVANPEGLIRPDQAPPPELKNPIHLEASGLVFNRDTGNASATGRVIFQMAQASGSAVGIDYIARTGILRLLADISVDIASPQQAHVTAEHAEIHKQPRQAVFIQPRMSRDERQMRANKATFFLRPDNTVEHVVAEGDVEGELSGASTSRSRADRADLQLEGPHGLLRTATLTGNVQMLSEGSSPIEAYAGKVLLLFAGRQVLERVHAEEGVRLIQRKGEGSLVAAKARSSDPQDVELSAPAMDFVVKDGHRLERAETSGSPQIVIAQPAAKQNTVVTAAKFTFTFDEKNRLAGLHGEPDARIVNSTIGQTDRVSTSRSLEVIFRPTGGITSIAQDGDVAYVDGTRKAWAQHALYATTDQMLVMSGSPRISDSGMTTTAQVARLNRATGDAFAEGDVKSTYSELKAQPNGGLLASADPIHVTSRSVTARRSPVVAVYSGNARLWQNANVVEAPSIEFDREHRSLLAQATAAQPVSTVLVQMEKSGKVTPVAISSSRLTYNDSDRKMILDGGVTAKGADVTMTGKLMTVFLHQRNELASASSQATPGQLDRIVAEGNIVITQSSRRATGNRLEYDAAEDRFVLTGGSPSIFDAEHGKITGDSLTFFRRDDRVLVEGRETSPTTTRTRVAR